jgi:hypothetical protein
MLARRERASGTSFSGNLRQAAQQIDEHADQHRRTPLDQGARKSVTPIGVFQLWVAEAKTETPQHACGTLRDGRHGARWTSARQVDEVGYRQRLPFASPCLRAFFSF